MEFQCWRATYIETCNLRNTFKFLGFKTYFFFGTFEKIFYNFRLFYVKNIHIVFFYLHILFHGKILNWFYQI